MTLQSSETVIEPLHLCSRCARSNLSTLLFKHQDASTDVESVERKLGSLPTWDLNYCDICKFLFQCLPPPYRTDSLPGDEIKLVSRSREELAEGLGVIVRALNYDTLEQSSLRLECYRSASATKASHALLMLLRDGEWSGNKPTSLMVDFGMLSTWLKRPTSDGFGMPSKRRALGSNRSTHGKPSRNKSWETARLRVLEMELNVIDCTARCLVRLPLEEQYVTLSYV